MTGTRRLQNPAFSLYKGYVPMPGRQRRSLNGGFFAENARRGPSGGGPSLRGRSPKQSMRAMREWKMEN
ncbi:MAG: hypothetical protein LBT00_12275 [Spirochaetaceae bacterium]|nr:hypothetical protein [Spirochaetaceae bacterium]